MCFFSLSLSVFFIVQQKILMNVLAVHVKMVALVLILLVDSDVNAHRNGPVTYVKLVSVNNSFSLINGLREINVNIEIKVL